MGKDKLRRFAEMETFPNVIQPDINEVLNTDHGFKGNWNGEVFKRHAPIVLELGCGKGEYTIGLAREFPNYNFIGIDIKGARMWRGAKTAIEDNLDNVVFLRTRIEFIGSFFDKNEISQIWITFPDPQLKESRERKRLTHPLFLNRYRNFLLEDGVIHLKTDSKELYDFTLEILNYRKERIQLKTDDLYNSDLPGKGIEFPDSLMSVQTFYEKKFLEEGKKICYLKFNLNRSIENKG